MSSVFKVNLVCLIRFYPKVDLILRKIYFTTNRAVCLQLWAEGGAIGAALWRAWRAAAERGSHVN